MNGILDSEVLGDYDKCIRDMESIGGTGTGVMFPVCKEELKKCGVSEEEFLWLAKKK